MSKCLEFCTGIEILNQFYLKMSVCRHELGGFNPPTPTGNSIPDGRCLLRYFPRLTRSVLAI